MALWTNLCHIWWIPRIIISIVREGRRYIIKIRTLDILTHNHNSKCGIQKIIKDGIK
jgi:hypothetical protein